MRNKVTVTLVRTEEPVIALDSAVAGDGPVVGLPLEFVKRYHAALKESTSIQKELERYYYRDC